LPITSLASQNGKAYPASQGDDGWQRFTQLVAAVNASHLPAAQKAYDGFAKSAAADLTKANPASRLTQALDQVGQALRSGDIGRAQQALSSIRSRAQTSRQDAAHPPAIALPKTAASEQSAPGAALDVVV
jgi:hypothetical protein